MVLNWCLFSYKGKKAWKQMYFFFTENIFNSSKNNGRLEMERKKPKPQIYFSSNVHNDFLSLQEFYKRGVFSRHFFFRFLLILICLLPLSTKFQSWFSCLCLLSFFLPFFVTLISFSCIDYFIFLLSFSSFSFFLSTWSFFFFLRFLSHFLLFKLLLPAFRSLFSFSNLIAN